MLTYKEFFKLRTRKKPKLFISHSSKDKEYILAFVNMLTDIGIPTESIVCTSCPICGVPSEEKIYEWLREQFLERNLRALFFYSDNFNNSIACQNEVGLALAYRPKITLLLLPGFNFSKISGFMDNTQMGISFDADESELKYRLGELKDTLMNEFKLAPLAPSRWEWVRDDFIKQFKNITRN